MMEWNEDTERRWVYEMVEKMGSEPRNVLRLGLRLLFVAVIVFVLEGLILAGLASLYHFTR